MLKRFVMIIHGLTNNRITEVLTMNGFLASILGYMNAFIALFLIVGGGAVGSQFDDKFSGGGLIVGLIVGVILAVIICGCWLSSSLCGGVIGNSSFARRAAQPPKIDSYLKEELRKRNKYVN